MINHLRQRLFVGAGVTCGAIELDGQLVIIGREAIIQNFLVKNFVFGMTSSEFKTVCNLLLHAAKNVQVHYQHARIEIIFERSNSVTNQREIAFHPFGI